MRRLSIFFVFLTIFSLVADVDVFGAFDSAKFNSNTGPLKLLRITPDGEDVPPGRQIVFTFNRPVVPVGRMDRDASEIPVTIEPPLDCEWRWLNTSSLACQLGEKAAMAPATRYSITMHPGITAEDGAALKEKITHTFITQRPKVSSSWFETWQSPGMPKLHVAFDQPVTEASVAGHLFLKTHSGRRIPLTVMEDPDYERSYDYEPGRIWLVSPAEELPLDERMELRVEPGIVSMKGPEPGAEDRVVTEFYTFPEFRFLGVRCTTNRKKTVTISPDGWFKQSKRCDPLRRIYLLFSAPVIKDMVKEHLRVTPDLAGGRTDYDPWANVYRHSRLSRPHAKGYEYDVALPEVLRAYETYRLEAEAAELKDEFGRSLAEDIDMEFMTDHREPDFHLSNPFFVLEKEVDTEVPMVVTNLDEIRFSYETLTTDGKTSGQTKTLKIDEAEDIAYRIPLRVREMIPSGSGVVQGHFKTRPAIENYYDNWFFSQVSPYNVHVKVGHYNTLVWVTDFSTGLPVSGVEVDIYKDTFGSFDDSPMILSKALTNSNGIALLVGTEGMDPNLELLGSYFWNWREGPRMFVRCRKDGDMALVPLVSPFEVEARGTNDEYISSWLERRYGHIHTWGTTAQGVYKAGDTVQYKFYVRDQTNKVFTPAPRTGYSLKVTDPTGKVVHEVKDITLSEFGAHDGEFTVPRTGAVGWYRFKLAASFKKGTWEPMRVLVSDFTPAPFRVTTDLNGELFKSGDSVEVVTSARLHAGGPYANAQTRITARIDGGYFRPEDPKAKGFRFDVYEDSRETRTVYQTEASVDEKGNLQSKFTISDSPVLYGRLMVESAVRDDRGKYVASQATVTYVGRDRYVGIHQPDWVLKEDEPARVEALVVNEHGKAVPGTLITVKVEYRKTIASRVKGAGNAYLTQYKHEWVAAAECALTTTTDPVVCKFTPGDPGVYRMTAAIDDTVGRRHESSLSRWVVGKGRVLWETRPGNTLQIFPEKEDYRVGDVARYLVQNPYPGAKALITIERYGVLKSWITTFENSTEIVEFPIIPDYLPGYYLSVVIMSPRVEKPLGENQVDLGKPAFRMGYVRVPVRNPYKEIIVDVKPAKEVYKPRDTVAVDLHARIRSPFPDSDQPPMEFAVAVLDEAVFDLLSGGRSYFDPYRGFYYLDSLDLKNYDLIMQLVGRQRFEKKGANAGGDGGMDLGLRSLFKFVSYWNPSVKTDGAGRAKIEFEVPDNLTGWRILVMAVTASDRMGLGDATFKVNRPTEIRPALPNQVTEGDSFRAGFSVMNRTDKTRTLDVTVSAEGPVKKDGGKTVKSVKQVIAEPYKRYTVWLPVETTGDGEITFKVRAGDSKDRDALEHKMPVRKRASLEAAATYGTTVSDEVSEVIAFPQGIRTDVGRVSVVVSPTVIGNVEGAFKYMRDYPYTCWEQKLTKGLMASHYINLKPYIPESFEWAESEGLPKETLELAAEYQASNGGMVYYIPEDRYVSPYLSAYTAIAFNWLRAGGYKIPEEVEKRLHDYLLKLLRRDVMSTFYSKGMSSTVRAVALAALAPHGKLKLTDLKRYRRHVPEMSLFGKAHYLLALLKVPGTEAMQSDVVDMILSHASQTGGKFIFGEELDAGYERILASPLRDNGAVLSALLAYSETPGGRETIGDIPFKLVRTITQTRGARDRWENTQENMFCLNALIDFSRVYEKERPEMTLSAWLDAESMGEARYTDFRQEAVDFERPIKKGDPGRKTTVRLERKGSGRVYYSARLFYAPVELKARPINSGIEVRREYSVERNGQWILLGRNMEIKTIYLPSGSAQFRRGRRPGAGRVGARKPGPCHGIDRGRRQR
jgi:uncharacterized protein YfaS (alpha-2-macroglobulin family)